MVFVIPSPYQSKIAKHVLENFIADLHIYSRADFETQASRSDSSESASVSPTSPTIAYGDTYSSVVSSALVASA